MKGKEEKKATERKRERGEEKRPVTKVLKKGGEEESTRRRVVVSFAVLAFCAPFSGARLCSFRAHFDKKSAFLLEESKTKRTTRRKRRLEPTKGEVRKARTRLACARRTRGTWFAAQNWEVVFGREEEEGTSR